jgi:hypothetical protein
MLIKIELTCGIAQAIYLVYTIKFTLIQSLFYEFIIIRMKDRKKTINVFFSFYHYEEIPC